MSNNRIKLEDIRWMITQENRALYILLVCWEEKAVSFDTQRTIDLNVYILYGSRMEERVSRGATGAGLFPIECFCPTIANLIGFATNHQQSYTVKHYAKLYTVSINVDSPTINSFWVALIKSLCVFVKIKLVV